MQIQENFERSDCVAAAWIWDHLVIYLALSTKGLTSLCTHHFYPFIFSLIISLYFSSALQVADRTLSRPRPEGCCQGNRRPAAPRGEEIRGKSPLYDPCLSILTDCCCVWMLLFRYGTPRASGRASTWPLSTDMAECTTTVRRMSQQDQQHETDHANMYSIDKYVTYCVCSCAYILFVCACVSSPVWLSVLVGVWEQTAVCSWEEQKHFSRNTGWESCVWEGNTHTYRHTHKRKRWHNFTSLCVFVFCFACVCVWLCSNRTGVCTVKTGARVWPIRALRCFVRWICRSALSACCRAPRLTSHLDRWGQTDLQLPHLTLQALDVLGLLVYGGQVWNQYHSVSLCWSINSTAGLLASVIILMTNIRMSSGFLHMDRCFL